MAFIDSTYFRGELLVHQAASDTRLSQAITQYEKEILISLLGYELYAALQDDLVEGVPQTQKYKDLVDGKVYTQEYNGNEYTIKWNGLANTEKLSLIAYFVYYKYVERENTPLTGTGISITPAGKDWQRVSPVNKLCDVWERMRALYGIMPLEYKGRRSILGTDLPDAFDAEPSAYNFLLTNIDDYPEWVFTPIWNINKFGI